MRLSELRYGQSAKIRDIMGQDALSIRLIDLGFLPPARVIKTFSAPGGDPMAVRLRGTPCPCGARKPTAWRWSYDCGAVRQSKRRQDDAV